MYLNILFISILVIVVASFYIYINKVEKANDISLQNSQKCDSIESKIPKANVIIEKDTKPIYNSKEDTDKIYGKMVNFIGGSDVYASLPVSMDKTGKYSIREACNSCANNALGWRCKAHKYNNMVNISLKPEGVVNLCDNYTNKTPLKYDGIREINNKIMA